MLGAESFTLMTPAGHPEAGWVTFSSYVEDGRTFAQVQVLARASDPLYEVAFRLAGDKLQDQVWTHGSRHWQHRLAQAAK